MEEIDWFNDLEEDNFDLPSISDRDIYEIDDSYDDMRIGVSVSAYVQLRLAYQKLKSQA